MTEFSKEGMHRIVEELLSLVIDKLNQANLVHSTACGALVILLIDKGIITGEEYDRAHARATAIADQALSQKRDEQLSERDPT